jgi:glutaredoxin 3
MSIVADYTADVVIYTTGYCGFCFAAKRLLDAKGVGYREVGADRRPDLRSWLVEASGQRTVPQVFVNGEAIGGFSELAQLERSGELDGKLSSPPQGDFSPPPS